jgi:multidrug efflux pump
MEDTPQYNVDIDFEKAMALGVSVNDINATLSTAWGSNYVNDFVHQGRVKKVYVQADAPYRMQPEDLSPLVRAQRQRKMTPFTTFAAVTGVSARPDWNGTTAIRRWRSSARLLPASQAARPCGSSAIWWPSSPPASAMNGPEPPCRKQQAGAQAPALYVISILVVFLCLAALYESWSVPFSVILAVPLGILGALAAASLRGMENDVYFQVGLLTTIGLSAKNAILIVEFAKRRYDRGKDLFEATVNACRLRLRPILMTSMAFMLGVLPLAISTGAGANSRNAIGTGVLGGMMSATVLAIFFIPLFFYVVVRVFKPRARAAAVPTTTSGVKPQ